MAITPDGKRAISASDDHTLRLWDLESGQCLHTYEEHTREVTAVAISPDGKRALSASKDNTLRLWDLINGQDALVFAGEVFTEVNLIEDGHLIIVISQRGKINFIDIVDDN